MRREETKIMDNWEFTLAEPKESNFTGVTLPHDWVINSPLIKRCPTGMIRVFEIIAA